MRELDHVIHIRTPLLSRRASEYIAAIEEGNADGGACLDIIAGGDITEQLEASFTATDNHWDRHQKIFFNNGALPDRSKLDYSAAIDMSYDVIQEARQQMGLCQAAHLGIVAVQFSAAGAEIARNPSLAMVENPRPNDHLNMAKLISDKGASLARKIFDENFSDSLFGDYRLYPNIPNSYLGFLMNTQAAFWRNNRYCVNNRGVYSRLPSEFDGRVDQLLVRYPPKALTEDFHSALGRPDRATLRADALRTLVTFNKSLEAGGRVKEIDLGLNMVSVTSLAYRALQAAIARDVPADQRLPLIARSAATLVEESKRTAFGHSFLEEGLVSFEGPSDNLRLVIGLPELPKNLGDREMELLVRKTSQAGHCTARHFVELTPGGVTHTNVKELNAGFEEKLGVPQSTLLERDTKTYVHVGHLAIQYALLLSAYNDYH